MECMEGGLSLLPPFAFDCLTHPGPGQGQIAIRLACEALFDASSVRTRQKSRPGLRPEAMWQHLGSTQQPTLASSRILLDFVPRMYFASNGRPLADGRPRATHLRRF